MAAVAYSLLSSSSPRLITARPSSQRNNNHQGIASFGCTVRRSSGLGNGKLVLRCSSEDNINAESSDDSTVKEEVKDLKPDSTGKNEVEKPRLSKISTQLMNVENTIGDPHLASSIPIYQTATYKQKSALAMGTYAYTRFGNPTRDMLESILAKLDKAKQAFCFTSGMAALTAVSHLVKTGEEVVVGEDIYGGSDLLLDQLASRTGVVVKRVDMTNVDKVSKAVTDKTKLVWLESPTNPRIQISDIRKIAEITHTNGKRAVKGRKAVEAAEGREAVEAVEAVEGALLLVDNSIMSPVLSQPLELGADIVMHSATKFIGGHSDVMAGVLAVKEESLAEKLKNLQKAEGSGLSPFDCWVCLRGIKTMALRVEKQQENAQKIAEFLSTHALVTKVNYAGLPTHPGYELHISQANGAGSVLSFLTGSVATSKNIVESTKLFGLTVSFGNVKSLISMPGFMSHASIKKEVREARGLKEDLIRICVGIEDVDDLISDLKNALQNAPQVDGHSHPE